jgi:diguanylate cyclase (GGDEF)-like protein
VITSLGIAVGNTAEPLLGAYLVKRFASGWNSFSRAQSALRFILLAGMLSTTVSASVGSLVLWVSGISPGRDFWPIWLTWWLGDAAGIILISPFPLLWIAGERLGWDWRKFLEAFALCLYLFLVALVVFGQLSLGGHRYPLEFLCLPFLIWAALRLGQLEASAAVLFVSSISIWSILDGQLLFGSKTRGEALLLLQAYTLVIAAITHSVAAVVAERRRMEALLRKASIESEDRATSDPLTGLSNYRRFLDVFNAEAERSQRTIRSFALVIFDVDQLKKINDKYGHLAGTQTLCRVANILRVHCRNMDTAVRYGGDEFCLILPETNAEGAVHVAKRIAENIKQDREHPPISASYGVAVYPEDGLTLDEVFHKADESLYQMKGSSIQDHTQQLG